MKTLKYPIFIFISCCAFIPLKLSSQSQEVTQLLLNLEKFIQFKEITNCLSKQQQQIQIYAHLKSKLSSSSLLGTEECHYVQNYATKIIQDSLQNMDALIAVLNPEVYRMYDAQRLTAIDRSHKTIVNQLLALNEKVTALAHTTTQRLYEAALAMSLRWGTHPSSVSGRSSYGQSTAGFYENTYLKDNIQNPS